MQFHGIIHNFPKEVKLLIIAFVIMLSIGFFTGLLFVSDTTQMQSSGIEMQYLGNESDEDAEVMKFKKSKREVLTLVHNHILSLSVVFFFVSLILSTTSINKRFKKFLMIEPFVSLLLTFGGIYVLWTGVLWFKYVIMFSGMLMTFSYATAVVLILLQLFLGKKLN